MVTLLETLNLQVLAESPTTTSTTTSSTFEKWEADELPPIRFIDFELLSSLTSFPRYPDQKSIVLNMDDIDLENSLIVFISHCWLRPNPSAEGWSGKPHPDNDKNEKFVLIKDAVKMIWSNQVKIN